MNNLAKQDILQPLTKELNINLGFSTVEYRDLDFRPEWADNFDALVKEPLEGINGDDRIIYLSRDQQENLILVAPCGTLGNVVIRKVGDYCVSNQPLCLTEMFSAVLTEHEIIMVLTGALQTTAARIFRLGALQEKQVQLQAELDAMS